VNLSTKSVIILLVTLNFLYWLYQGCSTFMKKNFATVKKHQ